MPRYRQDDLFADLTTAALSALSTLRVCGCGCIRLRHAQGTGACDNCPCDEFVPEMVRPWPRDGRAVNTVRVKGDLL